MSSSIFRFFTVVLSETYECTHKFADIVNWQYVSYKRYVNTSKKKQELKKLMQHSNSYEEWKQYADEYDKMKDIQIWKETEQTRVYDWNYIKQLTLWLRDARMNGEFRKLMRTIRGNANRNIGNILNHQLYAQSFVGTKALIEEFQEEMVLSLEYLSELPTDVLSYEQKLEFFSETKHIYGNTALIFSGGANLGFFHYGVIKALYEEGMLPKIISGSSVGSITATLLGTTKLEDVKKILIPENITYDAFYRGKSADKLKTIVRRFQRFLKEGVMLDVNIIKEFVRDNIGDITFKEAYDKTGWIVNISVTGYEEHDENKLLNYLTAPNVVMWSAVCASCGIPFLYGPSKLYFKDDDGEIKPYMFGNRKFMDGSIGADLPTQNISEMFNVNYFIVSQTNPWVVPFLNYSDFYRHQKRAFIIKIFEFLKDLIGSEFRYRVSQFADLGILPKFLSRYLNLITQKYGGNITIWPKPDLYTYLHLLDSPNHTWIRAALVKGANRVYHKMNHMASVQVIERALERNYEKVLKQNPSNNMMLFNEVGTIENRGSVSKFDQRSVHTDNEDSEKKLSRTRALSQRHRIGSFYKLHNNKRLSSLDLFKKVEDDDDSSEDGGAEFLEDKMNLASMEPVHKSPTKIAKTIEIHDEQPMSKN